MLVFIQEEIVKLPVPKSNKELDKLDRLGYSNRDMLGDLIAVILNRPLKDVELKYDDSYPGAGYGFIVDLEKLVKKLFAGT